MPRTSPSVTFATTTFTSADIRACTVTEEFNPISIVLPISKLDLLLYSSNAAFSIISPTGDYELLQYLQPLNVYIDVDGEQRYIGRYYLEDWENVSDTLIRLTCMDEMGVMDTLEYKGGLWITPTSMGTIIENMLNEINVDFEIDPVFDEVLLKGWIPICSYREALQQVCFAGGAYVLVARQNGFIKIGTTSEVGAVTKGVRCGVPGVTGAQKSATTSRTNGRIWQKRWRASQWEGVSPTIPIPLSEQAGNPSLSLRTQVTGVEVSLHDISEGSSSRLCFEGYKAIGDYSIYFTQPMHTLVVLSGYSGVGTITSSGANYCVLHVTTAGNFKIEGKVYVDSVTKYGVYTSDPNVKPNILTIDEASMLNSSNGDTVANWVFDYFQKRHVQKLKLIAPFSAIAGDVLSSTLYNRVIVGVIEKATLDLKGGYVVQAEIVGYPQPL